MTDFTKEELEKILNCINFTCWKHPGEDEKLTEIRLKICEMIGSIDMRDFITMLHAKE